MNPENQNTPLPCPCGENPCGWYVAINFVEDRGYYAQLERDCGSRGPKVLEISRGAAIAKAKEAWGRIVRPQGEAAKLRELADLFRHLADKPKNDEHAVGLLWAANLAIMAIDQPVREAAATVKESLTTEPAPADVEAVIDLYWGPGTATERLEIMRAAMAAIVSQAEQRARQAGREEAIRECAEIAADVANRFFDDADLRPFNEKLGYKVDGAVEVKARILSKLTPPTDKEE